MNHARLTVPVVADRPKKSKTFTVTNRALKVSYKVDAHDPSTTRTGVRKPRRRVKLKKFGEVQFSTPTPARPGKNRLLVRLDELSRGSAKSVDRQRIVRTARDVVSALTLSHTDVRSIAIFNGEDEDIEFVVRTAMGRVTVAISSDGMHMREVNLETATGQFRSLNSAGAAAAALAANV